MQCINIWKICALGETVFFKGSVHCPKKPEPGKGSAQCLRQANELQYKSSRSVFIMFQKPRSPCHLGQYPDLMFSEVSKKCLKDFKSFFFGKHSSAKARFSSFTSSNAQGNRWTERHTWQSRHLLINQTLSWLAKMVKQCLTSHQTCSVLEKSIFILKSYLY